MGDEIDEKDKKDEFLIKNFVKFLQTTIVDDLGAQHSSTSYSKSSDFMTRIYHTYYKGETRIATHKLTHFRSFFPS